MVTTERAVAVRRVQADRFEADKVDLAALAGTEPNDRSELLGHLFWFTISGLAMTRQQLEACLDAAGISPAMLPGPIRDCDAFRRATTAVERKRVEADGKDLFWNLLVREVRSNSHEVVRHLVVETVDARNVRLGYADLRSLRLNRPGHGIEQADLDCAAAPGAWALADRATAEALHLYQECLTHYNDRHIREALAAILGPGEPVCVRPSGGVYFIPRRHQELLLRARALVRSLDPYSIAGGRSRLYHVPVVDGSDQREMVEISLEEQVQAELRRLTTEMADLLKAGKAIRPATADGYIQRIRALGKQTATYRELLQTDLVELEAAVDLVREQGMVLLARAE